MSQPDTTQLPVAFRLPTWSQCDEKAGVNPFEMTALEDFIHQNEPAGEQEQVWRQHLAEVLAEVVEEDRKER